MIFWNRGIRIPHDKEPAASRGILPFSPAGPVLVPLCYGDTSEALPAAAAGAQIGRGEVLSDPGGDTPSLATVTGTFEDIRTISHPVVGQVSCAVLRPRPEENPPPPQPALLTAQEAEAADALETDAILDAVRRAGIIDELDGIPLHLKLADWKDKAFDVLVADGTEAEPYASSAWAVLTESAEDVWRGLALAARAAGIPRYHVAVLLPTKRRRPLAQRLGEEAVYQVRSKYPADRLTGGAGRSAVCRIGVQAALALCRAAALGEPQTSCVLTVAGDAVANPQNVRVPFGTPAGEVLRACGLSSDPQYLIFGDAMTGVTADSVDTPILPGTTCLLALVSRTVLSPQPCMGCGRCARVCHADLLPYEIVRRLENMHYERLVSLEPEACDGCGACSHVCPAGRDVTAKVLEARQTRGTIFLNWGDDDDA